MAIGGAGQPSCPETGLAVPECSCRRCLEIMLHEFSPQLLTGEIKLTRGIPSARPGRGEYRETA